MKFKLVCLFIFLYFIFFLIRYGEIITYTYLHAQKKLLENKDFTWDYFVEKKKTCSDICIIIIQQVK